MALPGAVAKTLHVLGMTGKEETTQNTAIALVGASDGLQLFYRDRNVGAILKPSYLYDGNVGPTIGALGNTKRIRPQGLAYKGSCPMLFRGPGIAYSASIFPSFHRWLKAAGFTAVGSFGAGTESWTYSPTVAGSAVTTMTTNLYTRLEMLAAVGVMGSIKADAPDGNPPLWTFDFNGIATLPADNAGIAITYPNAAVDPPGGAICSLTLGGLTTAAVVRKSGWDMARKVTERFNANGGASGAHAGFAPDDRDPVMTMTLERTALVGTPFTSAAAFDAWNLRDSAQGLVAILQYGTAQYNRVKVNFPQAQVIDVTDSNDKSISTVDLTIAAYNTTPSSNDDMSIVCD